VLTSRIDAARRGDISPLRCVRMQISRRRQRDIRKEVLGLAKSAGFEMKLELRYTRDGPPYRGRLSPSFFLPPMTVEPFQEPDSESTVVDHFSILDIEYLKKKKSKTDNLTLSLAARVARPQFNHGFNNNTAKFYD
jgi:hypothetical protein